MRDILKFKGIITRQTWWITTLIISPLLFYIKVFAEAFDKVEPTLYSLMFAFFILLLWFALIYIRLTATVARIKDAGFNGWWSICPIANFVMAGFCKTHEGETK